jgi:hypothetical protein
VLQAIAFANCLPDFPYKLNKELKICMAGIQNTVWARQLKAVAESILLGEDNSASECSSVAETWIDGMFLDIDLRTWYELDRHMVTEMPFMFKIFLDKDDSDEFIGINGQYTEELMKKFDHNIQFWESTSKKITISDTQLYGLHGSFYRNTTKLAQTVQYMFPELNDKKGLAFTRQIQKLLATLPRGEENPLLSFNALAVGSCNVYTNFLMEPLMPPSILMGDGMLEFLEIQGLGNEGPDFVLAHEIGHHLQFDVQMRSRGSMHDELNADAFAAYYMAHEAGDAMTTEQITQGMEAAYSVGDCYNSHGSPAQRACAVAWGASLAIATPDIILHPRDFIELYREDLKDIFDLDGESCTLIERPSELPSKSPSNSPSKLPSESPSKSPSLSPSAVPRIDDPGIIGPGIEDSGIDNPDIDVNLPDTFIKPQTPEVLSTISGTAITRDWTHIAGLFVTSGLTFLLIFT